MHRHDDREIAVYQLQEGETAPKHVDKEDPLKAVDDAQLLAPSGVRQPRREMVGIWAWSQVDEL